MDAGGEALQAGTGVTEPDSQVNQDDLGAVMTATNGEQLVVVNNVVVETIPAVGGNEINVEQPGQLQSEITPTNTDQQQQQQQQQLDNVKEELYQKPQQPQPTKKAKHNNYDGMPVGVPNPWAIENLDDFLFYCCPQCDHKVKSKHLFLNHAFVNHPLVSHLA